MGILGKIGASVSHFFIFKLFGIGSFVIPIILFISSYYLLFNKKILTLIKNINWLLVLMIWTIIFSGFVSEYYSIQIGIVGFELNSFLETYRQYWDHYNFIFYFTYIHCFNLEH